MSVLAFTLARPHAGKRQALQNRARRAGDIYARHGASVKLSTFVAGPNTGCIALIRSYPDFRTAAKTFQALGDDPQYLELQKQREEDPLGEFLVRRDIVRRIYGEGKWSTHPISHLRHYDMARNKLAGILELFPELSELVSAHDVNVIGLLPVVGDNLSSLTVSYQFRSLDHWAEALDTVGTSDAFQAIVARASEFGSLRSAGTMVPLES